MLVIKEIRKREKTKFFYITIEPRASMDNNTKENIFLNE